MLCSCAVSLDGCLDDATGTRLVLSDAADADRVDQVRAGCDAILVGAGTVRADDPRLVVRSAARRGARAAGGRPPTPLRVVLSGSSDLDPAARLFTADGQTLVYTGSGTVAATRDRLGGCAEVIPAGEPPDLGGVLDDLVARGVGRLLVEGGQRVLTGFLTGGFADELHLAVAPFFVGDPRAPRFVAEGTFPWHAGNRARLVEARPVGDMALLRYALSDRFDGS